MKYEKKYYNKLDYLRVILCVIVLLYHLTFLKGGYIAVCAFFVLSGYLSTISVFKSKKFSFKDYYINRLKRLYIPVLLVTLISLSIISLLPNLNWLNLKPETTSVLFGYNNFWQLNANLDYFARHINSPFIHLWYIAILLQLDLIFPFFYSVLKKIEKKSNKLIPCLIVSLLAIGSTIWFIISVKNGNTMFAYYNTFTRLFSWLLGILTGLIITYYGHLIPKFIRLNDYASKLILTVYTIIFIVLSIFIEATSNLFIFAMIISSLITCRLIEYATLKTKKKITKLDRRMKFFSSVSYEIYLFQYPVIFVFQYLNWSNYISVPLIIILTLILSVALHFCLDLKNNRIKPLKYTLTIILLLSSFFGLYKYITAKDYTEEMKQLEELLNQNEKIMEEKQAEYALRLKAEEEALNKTLQDLENSENNLDEVIKNIPIVGVGDSVMLGAVPNLYEQFPKGYFDAKLSRTAWVVNGILKDLKNRSMLGNPIVFGLGANGDCPESCKDEIVKTANGKQIFWINATNDKDVHVNARIDKFAAKYENVHVIDWATISKDHPEYFVADGIHLTVPGRKAYVKAIYDSIYEYYLNDFKAQKEKILQERENELKSKYTFIGNELLINSYEYIKDSFHNANFITNKNYDYKTLKQDIEKNIKNKSINYNVVLVFDKTINLNNKKYQEIIDLFKDYNLIVLALNDSVEKLQGITCLNFYNEAEENSEYYMADGVHLTETGNKALGDLLNNLIKKE